MRAFTQRTDSSPLMCLATISPYFQVTQRDFLVTCRVQNTDAPHVMGRFEQPPGQAASLLFLSRHISPDLGDVQGRSDVLAAMWPYDNFNVLVELHEET
jgi:hypothetical protein